MSSVSIERQKRGIRRKRHLKISKMMKNLGYCGIHMADGNYNWICIRTPHPGSPHHQHVMVHISRFTIKQNGQLLKDGERVIAI